jgi:hypothetical protein
VVGSSPLNVLAANVTSRVISGLLPGESVEYAIFAYNHTDRHSEGILSPLATAADDFTRYGHQATVGVAFAEELLTNRNNLLISATV